MPATEMVVMIAVTSAIVLGVIHLFRLVAAAILHRTIRQAMERNPELAERLLQEVVRPVPAQGDDRLAILLVTVGIATIAASVIIGESSWMHYAIAGALFPLFVGTALWLRHIAIVRARRDGRE